MRSCMKELLVGNGVIYVDTTDANHNDVYDQTQEIVNFVSTLRFVK